MNFCVKCGRDCAESLEGMCVSCWLDGRKLSTMPHHVDLKVCANCGEFCFNERWYGMKVEDAVAKAAQSAIRIIEGAEVVDGDILVSKKDPFVYEVTLQSVLDIMGYVTTDTASVIVRIKKGVCKPCSRKLGSYYTSILQIRAGSKDLSPELRNEVLTAVEKSVAKQAENNKQLFITKTELVTGGVDVYLSSISLGKSLMKELGETYCAETKESPKLVGQTADGQDMYRLTYLVRLPEYHVGDVVISGGRYCKLLRISSYGGRALDLFDFREKAVRKADIPSLKLYEKAGNLKEATVISRSGREIQIMHPDNYSAVDLKVPEGYEAPDTVHVVPIDDVLYLVP
ncbi:MAG: hypothetical protein IKP20_00390 [Candidatus Methanomethylophilaceae archaeon]|nr:hypothetical protein [Candidatus Methanomethylophilaceae archaeon]